MAPVERGTPRLDAKTIISYAKKFQDYELGGHQPLGSSRVPIGSVSNNLNQLEMNRKIVSFAKSRNSANIVRSNLAGVLNDQRGTYIKS